MQRSGFWLLATYEFRASAKRSFRLSYGEYRRARSRMSEIGAAEIGRDGQRVFWWTAAGMFWADDALDCRDVALLVWDRERRSDARLDRLRSMRAREEAVAVHRRARIPEEVRAFVWDRDEGRCVRCAAEDDLQFDHVIPVARGGSASVDNVQVLCGECNRLKSDSVASPDVPPL